jgi:hypothetical protein
MAVELLLLLQIGSHGHHSKSQIRQQLLVCSYLNNLLAGPAKEKCMRICIIFLIHLFIRRAVEEEKRSCCCWCVNIDSFSGTRTVQQASPQTRIIHIWQVLLEQFVVHTNQDHHRGPVTWEGQ